MLHLPRSPSPRSAPTATPQRRFELDIYFTTNFHEKASKRGLSDEHSCFVCYQGDIAKENMKVATSKGEEIGIDVFLDRETNQSVITSVWNRQFQGRKKALASR